MGNEAEQQVVDPAVFMELSATQRVVTVLKMSGRSDEQISALMGRHGLVGTMVNNILTCRGDHAEHICACTQDRLEQELAKYAPVKDDAPWTHLETRDLIMAVAKPMSRMPGKLVAAFAARSTLQANPA